MSAPDAAIDRAATWLAEAQLTSGELPSYASPLDAGPPTWVPDQLNFITALAASALRRVDHPSARGVSERAVRFLLEEREGPMLWRYWARSSAQHHWTPIDADDTACCSMAVAFTGRSTTANHRVLVGSMVDGRFPTWLLWRGGGGWRSWWALRDERRAATRAMRAELWATTEAAADDVDAVVNANVCRYLGPAAPASATAWLAELIRTGAEHQDRWHRSPFALWAAVADGHRRRVEAFAPLAPRIIELVADRRRADGAVGSSYETALALDALVACDAPGDLRDQLARALVERQGADGAWPRDVCYHGGPKEVFGWASEALTTAVAAGALAGHLAGGRRS